MDYFFTSDDTRIYYKDWGSGQPVVFSHGWPLSSDAWDSQMTFLASRGFRCIAHDRRGHGRSGQPWAGNNMDSYAADLATLIVKLDLKNCVLVGHSTGGGEIARYIGMFGIDRVAKVVLVSAVTPLMVKTQTNPDGVPVGIFDGLRESYLTDRAQFFLEIASGPFYGFNRPGATISQGLINSWWRQGMMSGHVNALECIRAFSETDFTDDLKKINVPTLIIHGDDDQIVPMEISARVSSKIIPGAILKVYKGGAHGLPEISKSKMNSDLDEFLGQ